MTGDGPAGIVAITERLVGDPRCVGRIRLPARAGRTADWPHWLHPDVRRAYEDRGIAQPWRHQVRTADLAWSGQHVLVASGTASGKSAAFGMPALTVALAAPEGAGRRGPTVLYLSPTKALAHDQLAGLSALRLPGLRVAAVDGDTPDEQRAWARAHARWVVTNPGMLHRGILPRHEAWRAFLRSLQFVIVDEAHTYRGVFGSHVALVLRRLRRVAVLHGAAPSSSPPRPRWPTHGPQPPASSGSRRRSWMSMTVPAERWTSSCGALRARAERGTPLTALERAPARTPQLR